MGGTSKFKFPMPHRRSKQPTLEVQTISAPMTNKAQKFLGQAEINVDSASPTSSNTDSARFWETRSAVSGVSGISVTISESTATGTVTKSRSPLGTLQESTVATGSMGNNRAAWEQESDIIPKGLGVNGSSAGRNQNMDTITDASSVRRRGSSSTIASYYDKTKLPLSISQQTSNSAMAKGLPNKAQELLDMDSPRPAPAPPKSHRKKPTRLELTHLLPTAGTSSRNALSRLAHKSSMVLGPDLMTRSPSVVSLSSAVSPSDSEPKPEKKPRRKLTRESLRGFRGPRHDRHSTLGTEEAESASLRMRAMDAGAMHHLYEHYENTSYRDTMNADALEFRPDSQQGGLATEAESWAATRRDSRHSASIASTTSNKLRRTSSAAASRQPYATFSPDSTYDTKSEMSLSATNAGLVSPPTDYAASVSSRHTRTSRASKWTDHSFTDFDPNANSVLSLSSDSEDEFSEPSRTAMSVLSVASGDSMSSPPESRRPSNTSLSQESIRKQLKSKFRSSVNSQAPFLAIPEDIPSTTGTSQPAISPRTTSLASALASASTTQNPKSNAAPSIATTTSSVRSPSRLSQVSTSTCESVASQGPRPHPSGMGRQPPDIRHVAMLQSHTAPTGQGHHEPASVAEKPRRASTKHSSPRISEPTLPASPSSMDAVISSQRKATTEQDSPVLTLNGTDGAEDERFIAVTRQEELLLAAMRAKRALMRESHQASGIEGLEGRVKDERTASKKESLSSIKTVKANTLLPLPLNVRPSGASNNNSSDKIDNVNNDEMAMLFPKPPTTKPSPTTRADGTSEVDSGSEEVMVCLDRTISEMQPLDMADMSPDLRDLMHYKSKQLPAPPSSSTHSATRSSRSRTSSAAPANTTPKRERHEANPRPDSDFMPAAGPLSAQIHGKPDVAIRSEWHPTDIEPVMERPDSSSSYYEEESEIEKQPPSRMRQVRISAVGMQLPEIGQWGDDG